MWQRGMQGKGGHVGQTVGGVYVIGHAWHGAIHGRGSCMAGGTCMTGDTATAADGAHPTGMHSFLKRMT